METLETSRVCRLCGKQSGISINIFDKNENHVKKITAVLPIMVHEMDLLPKHMCHRCSYKLEEFHKFYVECLRMDAHLKSKLSWMRKEGGTKERPGVPMVHIENVKIKTEPSDYDVYELEPIMGGVDYINTMRSMQFPVDMVNTASVHEGVPYTTYARCRCYCDKERSEHAAIAKDYESTRCNETDEPTNTKTGSNTCDLNVLRSLRSEKESFHSRDSHRDLTTDRLIVLNDMVECARTSTTRTITRSVSSSTPLKSNVNSNSMKVKEDPSETRINENANARSLRPRKVTVDYYVSKRRSRPSTTSPSKTLGSDLRVNLASEMQPEVRPVAEMKTEKADSLVEGRVLRPRNKLGNSQNAGIGSRTLLVNDSEQIIQEMCAMDNGQTDSKPQRANYKGRRIETRPRMMIKKEVLNIGGIVSNESDVLATRQPQSAAKHLARVKSRTIALRKNVDVENNIEESCKPVPSSNARLCSPEVVQPLGQIGTNSPNKRKKSSKSVTPVCYSPKYLRSQDLHLRSGKIKKVELANSSLVKRLRRGPKRIGLDAEMSKHAGNNSLKLSNEKLKDIDGSISTKLVVRDIKYYCEKCNTPFVNQELYKLHGCYV